MQRIFFILGTKLHNNSRIPRILVRLFKDLPNISLFFLFLFGAHHFFIYLCIRNEQTDKKVWSNMAIAVDIRIDAAAVGHALPRGCGECVCRLYGVCPPCAPLALCSLCGPSGRLSALSVSTFSLYGSSHDGAGAIGCLSAAQTVLPERQDDTSATVCTIHPWAAIGAVIPSEITITHHFINLETTE